MHPVLRRLVACALLAASFATNAGELRLPMPNNEAFVLSIPEGWRPQTRPTIPGQPHTGRITASAPGQFEMLVTAIIPAQPDSPRATQQSVRSAVERAAAHAAPKAIERDIAILDLAIPGVHGFYFLATDKNPGPNEYRYLIQGQFTIRELVVVFTVLMNGDARAWSDAALAAIRTARRE